MRGSYGGALVIQPYSLPLHYVALAASGGVNSSDNPVAIREHQNPAYQGLRLISGNGRPSTRDYDAPGHPGYRVR